MSGGSDDGFPSDIYESEGSVIADDDSDFEVSVQKDTGKAKSSGPNYSSLSSIKLQELVDADIERVAGLTGLHIPIASILLQYFRWDQDKLIEKFIDDSGAVLREAGEPQNVPDPASPELRPSKRARLDTPANFFCDICCCEAPHDEVFKLRCTHAFCQPCWQMYVTSKVKEEGQCFFYCMQEGCKTYVDEPSIRRLVDKPIFERYRELVHQSYVSARQDMRFCPHPSCTETVLYPGGARSTINAEVPIVHCGQGHAFCFGCGLDSDHRPLICKFVGIWLQSAREDAGTSQWMKANTRKCPKCQNGIEKAGGCNRILCRHCQYQFCWLCMKNWDVHGYNNEVCNTWKEPEPDEETTQAKQVLDKWLFYFDRFNNHELSARLDQELVERTEEKMVEVQESSELSWIEAKFMQHAVDELTQCRITLKWTYAMAYFLAPGNHKQIFEDIQADLEKAVEDLSQLLEDPVEKETTKVLRQRMMDKTVYVRGRHEIVLQDTAEGLAEGRWEWTMPLE
ncbi:hypothetical protein WOLCODRAFT_136378 [Wolfiporia cocos MD-104 SS10]|uniref:RBR-type E3 ubiquitin transferase n=1 Tax=Wolfiporia cocos (strain MD-104) TaxID=742152 RepID=A0A2H3JLN7_WOLCO|nr:hypothetical protein WOLCODRAFT_136378 [Wolfiporia cocos MD-104 SS10]